MKIQEQLTKLSNEYNVVAQIDLDRLLDQPYETAQADLAKQLQAAYQDQYHEDDRVVVRQTQGDVYVRNNDTGLFLRNLQVLLNEQDISNFFVVIVSNNPRLQQELDSVQRLSTDPVAITGYYCNDGEYSTRQIERHPNSRRENYQYGSVNPLKISLNDLTDREQFLLTDSRRFCMYPWTHLHTWPTGQAFPCCMAENTGQVGDCKTNTLKEIWNDEPMRELRRNMLNEQPSPACTRCYEQEEAGFFNGRKSANKHHGHLIHRVAETKPDGSLDRFEMTYWDLRFSNLCNLSCRSCGHIFSSSWYADQTKLAGAEWAQKNRPLNYAGRFETDMWEQLKEHLDYVEQIYFAGGEPLMMEEHYLILEELERRGRFDVRLIYNTNFTQTKLKDREVFDYWRKFESVAVGASLDAMGPRAEYIRKGTNWDRVERNRIKMLEVCPDVDFYISPTLSILNAWHITDFHKNWTDRGLIAAKDLNVNCLQDPAHYRLDIAPIKYKQLLRERYEEHLSWLRPQDSLGRATQGFESAINFMMATDNTNLIDRFWNKTRELDNIRNETIDQVLPELEALK